MFISGLTPSANFTYTSFIVPVRVINSIIIYSLNSFFDLLLLSVF